MADIHIQRDHGMGLTQARQTARHWATQAEEKYQLRCSYNEGTDADTFSFERAGVSGTLQVTGQTFKLDAKLGFLLGAFSKTIESEIEKNLDDLLAKSTPVAAKKAAKKK